MFSQKRDAGSFVKMRLVPFEDKTPTQAKLLTSAPTFDATQGLEVPEDRGKSPHHVKKLNSLQRRLLGHKASVAKTSLGELMLDGQVLRGTNYTAAFNGLYVNHHVPPKGTRELVLKLKQLGIPKSYLLSDYAHSVYGQTGGTIHKRKQVLRVY
jgi:hypothetical protein